jgi:hypothetical protein
MEKWLQIKGFEGFYEISNLGRVKTTRRYVKNKQSERVVPERILKPTLNEKGYLRVRLSVDNIKTTKRVHRLVAEHFIPPIVNKPEVNHIDSNKENNRVENLEWIDRKENVKHYRNSKNYKSYNQRISNEDREIIRQKFKSGIPQKVLSDEYGVRVDTISKIITYGGTYKNDKKAGD